MSRLSKTLETLVGQYGARMTTSEVGYAIKRHPNTVRLIPDSQLPVERGRGRGGNRYLTADVGLYISRLPAPLAPDTAVDIPEELALRLSTVPAEAAEAWTRLHARFLNHPFELEIAMDSIDVERARAAPIAEALHQASLIEGNAHGLFQIPRPRPLPGGAGTAGARP